jgi:hypothetical protein
MIYIQLSYSQFMLFLRIYYLLLKLINNIYILHTDIIIIIMIRLKKKKNRSRVPIKLNITNYYFYLF